MIYTLCNGDITKKRWIEENLDITDYIEWISFKKYDNYVEAESNKRYQAKNK
jgi:hypothetical protein